MKAISVHRFFASLRMTWFWATTLLLVVLAGISACSKIDGPDPDDGWDDLDGNRPIKFSSSIARPVTKATLDNNTTFGVFAFYTGTSNWSSSAIPNFMFNEDVLYSNSTYTYAPVKYWPNNQNDKVSFWAYAPYTADITDDIVVFHKANSNDTYTNDTHGLPYLVYTVVQGKTDLLVADPVYNQTKPSINQAVTFNFHHSLSKIKFTVKTQNAQDDNTVYRVQLTSIQFQYIKKTAIHNNSSHWSSHNNEGTVSAFSGTQDVTTSVTEITDANVMLIPQTLVPMSRIHIEYRVSQDNGETYTSYSGDKFINGTTWTESTEYTYNISITPGCPIIFTVSWNSWGNIENYHITD